MTRGPGLVPMPEKPTRRRFLGSAAAASVPFCLSAMGAADLDAEAGAWMLLGFGVLGVGSGRLVGLPRDANLLGCELGFERFVFVDVDGVLMIPCWVLHQCALFELF